MIFKNKTDPSEGIEILSEYAIYDVHTHILPSIDDGSQSLDESRALLSELSGQGIRTVIATPHFYASEQSPDAFILKRDEALYKLKEDADASLPLVKVGAEVLYFRGISRIDNLKSLCIEGTNTLLLEMPTDKWSEYMLREVVELQDRYNVVMAHIERYFKTQSDAFFETLLSCGIKMQVNADSFMGKNKRKLIKLLANGDIHFIGSDCHGIDSRQPHMSQAAAVIHKALGDDIFEELRQNCKKYF